MPTQLDVPQEVLVTPMINNANYNADTNGITIDTKNLVGRGIIQYDAAFVSGTSTLDVALFEADEGASTPDVAGSFAAVTGGDFTQVGGSGTAREQAIINFDGSRKRFIRLQINVGAAGSPVYAVQAQLIAKKLKLPVGNVTAKFSV